MGMLSLHILCLFMMLRMFNLRKVFSWLGVLGVIFHSAFMPWAAFSRRFSRRLLAARHLAEQKRASQRLD